MKQLLCLLAFLVSLPAQAIDFSGLERFDVTRWSLTDTKLLEVSSVYVDYMHYTWAAEPFMLPTVPTNRLDLHVNVELLNRTIFINNMVHSETDAYQYRLIGWNYRFGIHIGSNLDLYYEHFSQHLLDTAPITGANTYDAIGFRLYLFRRKE